MMIKITNDAEMIAGIKSNLGISMSIVFLFDIFVLLMRYTPIKQEQALGLRA
jgi:hypothetical protein